MRTKLLLLSLFSTAAFSQSVDYYTDGTYNIVTSATPIDESPTGANAAWDFSDLTVIGTSTNNTEAPSADDLTTYPNTTEVSVISVAGVNEQGKLFTASSDGMVSITGAITAQFNANYSTNNATLGTFPMSFGDIYTDDNVSGTYSAPDTDGTVYEGTFTGTSTTSFDAYGSLHTSDNGGTLFAADSNVTRLKMVQNLTLSHPEFGNVGTVTQTTYLYYYYGNTDGEDGTLSPVFRSTTTTIVVPLLDIDQTDTSLENYTGAFLGLPHVDPAFNRISITPNPVVDYMNVETNNALVRSVKVMDSNGNTVKNVELPGNAIDLGGLSSGLYFAQITTANGVSTQKIIKK